MSSALPQALPRGDDIRRIEHNVGQAILGKPEVIRLAVTALLARGHVLIEDVPGVGKTTLARALARSLGGTFHRIQFTSDLLPADILGVSVFNQETTQFEFRPGPIFANVVLADEINRTTPRTQSSLLEAMNEGQVSIDNTTYPLEQPFIVLATMNPQEHYGTYPLPESQLDRFLLHVCIGYPALAEERQILMGRAGESVEALRPVVDSATIRRLQAEVETVTVEAVLVDYSMAVVRETRTSPYLALGVSTRGALAWYRAAQAHALCDGRHYCLPDDFKQLAIPVMAHRVVLSSSQDSLARTRSEAERIIADVLERVPIPL